MANFGRFIGAAEGGAAGGSAFGPWGAAIGGFLGGISSLFGPDPEEERQKRHDAALAQYMALRKKAVDLASRHSAGLVQGATQGAAERAAAAGHAGSVEAYVLPAADRAARIGNESVDSASRSYDSAIMGLEGDFANRPIPAPASDYVVEGVNALGEAKQISDYYDRLEKMSLPAQNGVAPPPPPEALPSTNAPAGDGMDWGTKFTPPDIMRDPYFRNQQKKGF